MLAPNNELPLNGTLLAWRPSKLWLLLIFCGETKQRAVSQ